MANCLHPHNLRLALENPVNRRSGFLPRMMGIQANASMRNPEELDQSRILHKDDYGFIIEEMGMLRTKFGFMILGGCCGTDDVFIDQLARALKNHGWG
jgi:methionine synthase I (cobalamin-dependent)